MRIVRLLAILLGLVLTLFGLLTLVSTITGLVLVGFDDELDSGSTRFESPTAAIAARTSDLGQDSAQDRAWGGDDQGELRVDASGDDELFLGVGPTDAVRDYLDQVPWDEVDVLSVGRFSTSTSEVDYSRRGGSGSPAALPAPGEEGFWSASESGTNVHLDGDFRGADDMVVLMNADGSPDVTADGSVEVKLPRLSLALVVGAVIGAVILVIGLLFLLRVGRRRMARLVD